MESRGKKQDRAERKMKLECQLGDFSDPSGGSGAQWPIRVVLPWADGQAFKDAPALIGHCIWAAPRRAGGWTLPPSSTSSSWSHVLEGASGQSMSVSTWCVPALEGDDEGVLAEDSW